MATDIAITSALGAATLWITLQRTHVDGRACRDYAVADDAGTTMLTARAFNWGRDITINDTSGSGIVLLRRSRLFPITGRVAVLELPSLLRIGTVQRNGAFADAAGRSLGRYRDARSARSRLKENALQATFDAILGAGESLPSGPDSFVLEIDGALRGHLTHTTLPFTSPPAAEPQPRLTFITRWLPKRLLRSLSTPRGWQFTRESTTPGDTRVQIAAALFTIELSRW